MSFPWFSWICICLHGTNTNIQVSAVPVPQTAAEASCVKQLTQCTAPVWRMWSRDAVIIGQISLNCLVTGLGGLSLKVRLDFQTCWLRSLTVSLGKLMVDRHLDRRSTQESVSVNNRRKIIQQCLEQLFYLCEENVRENVQVSVEHVVEQKSKFHIKTAWWIPWKVLFIYFWKRKRRGCHFWQNANWNKSKGK